MWLIKSYIAWLQGGSSGAVGEGQEERGGGEWWEPGVKAGNLSGDQVKEIKAPPGEAQPNMSRSMRCERGDKLRPLTPSPPCVWGRVTRRHVYLAAWHVSPWGEVFFFFFLPAGGEMMEENTFFCLCVFLKIRTALCIYNRGQGSRFFFFFSILLIFFVQRNESLYL